MKLLYARKLDSKLLVMFCLTVHHFLARVQSLTCTTYKKFLLKSIMAVLTSKFRYQSNNKAFINKIKKAQYDTALAITKAIRRTSQEKLYAELGLLLNLGNGLGNWLLFIKFSLPNYQSIYFS